MVDGHIICSAWVGIVFLDLLNVAMEHGLTEGVFSTRIVKSMSFLPLFEVTSMVAVAAMMVEQTNQHPNQRENWQELG